MTPADRFNKLYFMLMKYVNKKAIKVHSEEGRFYEYMDVKVPYWNETAIVSMKIKGYEAYPVVRSVLDRDGEPDYGYVRGHEPHLMSWLMRPDADRCIIELERTIFMLS